MMKAEASIEEITTEDSNYFTVIRHENDQDIVVDQQFSSYREALDYLLAQGWQVKREEPTGSLHVDIRFRKP